ncbi:hypothetical protein P8452_73960 [Trifolium repens]|nr:hypothetical protein P8452_73960 [Trifolium repens]
MLKEELKLKTQKKCVSFSCVFGENLTLHFHFNVIITSSSESFIDRLGSARLDHRRRRSLRQLRPPFHHNSSSVFV